MADRSKPLYSVVDGIHGMSLSFRAESKYGTEA